MGKTVLITGAGRGLGKALAAEFTQRGDRVVAHARSAEALREVPHDKALITDLSQPESLTKAVDKAHIDTLDAIVHNAGVAAISAVADLSVDQWQDHMNVNVIAPAELTRLLLPQLRQSRGHVVFVNSGAGLRTGPQWSAYGASKHALRSMADALRVEEQANGVRVTSVYPSHFDTDMQRKVRHAVGSDYDPQRATTPETIAWYIASFVHAPADGVVNEVRIEPPNPLPIKPRD
ncbi:SDR family oxidoreductase [Natronoglycomyces albus]|uniref:SDR family oxidoreductase n=1 Tax=Natronoglycomyces albus TaxID=2811108 RepID=A0A895XLL5_9ACTN|nr:SDR family oxidoreductase [Natronoglycomyces albus]QSB04309.1 SDR family oxidoreductase [Natronoglycomyces albus]